VKKIAAGSARQKVVLFLLLLVIVRGPFYAAALIGGWVESRDVPLVMLAFAFLSAPPLLAVAVRLKTQRNLRGFGWKPGHPGYLLIGWAFPILVALVVYGVAWAAGLIAPVPGRSAGVLTLIGPTVGITLGFVISTLLFEELGWRGLLVPELARYLSFGRVALISGAVWALFHYPFLLWPAYATVPPTVSNVLAFTAGIIAASFPLAWLRLRSGSVWPAVLAHAAHNAFVNEVLAKEFHPTGPVGAALVGESGFGLVAGYAVLAWWCWKHRGKLPNVGEDASLAAPA